MRKSDNQIRFEWSENLTSQRSALIGGEPKLQLSNGYSLIFEQISRILGAVKARESQARVTRDELMNDTGLSDRQIENLCSMAVGMGLIKRISYNLLPFGKLVVEYDRFFEKTGTLWLCHYRLGSNPRNLVWHRFINKVIHDLDQFDNEKIIHYYSDLKDQYSEKSYRGHLPKEITTILTAYTDQALAKLNFLEALEGNQYRIRRSHAPIDPLIFLFSIYDFRNRFLPGDTAIEIPTLQNAENSPGRVFHLSGSTLRTLLDRLHQANYITIESQADLDQISLPEIYSALKSLERYYVEQPY